MDVANVLIIISFLISEFYTVVSEKFDGYVVEGDFAEIRQFPHAAFLYIECGDEQSLIKSYSCGSSILNQAILITAAHCLGHCVVERSFVTAFVGHKEKMRGSPYKGSSFKIHEKYDTREICNDIGLVRLKKALKLGEAVRRVSLRRHPPYDKPAKIAGWGYIDEYETRRLPQHAHCARAVRMSS
ncbi:hypothetical protein MSG28_002476 [Choristoneura fumiferana]|uniref:Uncharacterized protein n=1 Tax=Choristoneura fumiferana TaxID=7141 RepID=A0ACC0JW32_CHOFU|nr:hypothetical protein MSG28_002476 [Choristoneura fumiferana]